MRSLVAFGLIGLVAALGCRGSNAETENTPVAAHAGHGHGVDERAAHLANVAQDGVAYYTCPMHPSVRKAERGACPLCGMSLTPVLRSELREGIVVVDAVRRHELGIRTEVVSQLPLVREVRAFGEVKADEARLYEVNVRVPGWVESVQVARTGERVRAGQSLFTIDSPELHAAQLEHLAALRLGRGVGNADSASASRRRLLALGMTAADISVIERQGRAREQHVVRAPSGGRVLEKLVVDGMRIEAGMPAYRVADLRRILVEAEVFESDLAFLRAGLDTRIEFAGVPGGKRVLEAPIDAIYPALDRETRTGRLRIVVPNTEERLKPGMVANVIVSVPLGERLAVPVEAVVHTGTRHVVFIERKEGRLQPRQVRLGVRTRTYVEIAEGLTEGDRVVVSGNFLIAAESRIRAATGFWSESYVDSAE